MSNTTDSNSDSDSTRLGFICVQNSGRSQMAAAYAERECEHRGLTELEIFTGGTHPADYVHEEVVEIMREEGFDLADRTPSEITTEELRSCDYMATMGCSTLDVSEAEDEVDIRDWDLPDPHGQTRERVRTIRDEVRQRVRALFDEISDRSETET